MKKYKEWLKNEVEDYLAIEGVYDARTALKAVLEYIDQLDEPQQEKVVVNEVMAGHIENCKNLKLTLSDSLHLVVPEDKQKEVLFSRAWLDGYTVEKEKQYRVVFPSLTGTEEHFLVQGDNGIGGFWLDGDWDYIESSDMKALFTEQEIKAIDERYWAFREEVENE